MGDQIDFSAPIDAVLTALQSQLSSAGEDLAGNSYAAAAPLLEWLNYFFVSERTGTCDEFLNGMRSSIVESIFCISAGLVRLAMFAMRAQIDIGLSWLYFKDHPVEYNRVHLSSDGFVMKSEVIKYLQTYYDGYTARWSKLLSNKTRNEDDPYRLLSAHVHSQSLFTMPAVGSFAAMISKDHTDEAIDIQAEVSEFLSDVFLASFGSKWANLPTSVIANAKSRLPGDSLSVVLS